MNRHDTRKRNGFKFNPQVWKTHSTLQFSASEDYSARWTSVAFEEAFSRYENALACTRPEISIPADWKTFAEETDTLTSVLYISLKQYIDYLAVFSKRFFCGDLFVLNASITEIESLRFPKPQIIPNSAAPLEYNTRMLRALLHILMYPGLDVCRCEMDVERSVSLLLSSFFDWFAILQPSSSTSEAIDSIRIFNRNSHPKWVRDGLVPIVFFPQRLQPINEQRNIARFLRHYAADNGPVPDILIPLIAAVESTLRLLLDHAIVEWKEKRRTDDKHFILPNWLFIHGIVCDALEINLYTFAPKVIECDNDGLPLKWEFACIPARISPLNIFRSRGVGLRVASFETLLSIQRHTNTICRILDGLKTAPATSPLVPRSGNGEFGECDEKTNKVDTIETNGAVEKTNDVDISETNGAVDGKTDHMDTIEANGAIDDVQDQEAAEATRCLLGCIHRTGLDSYRVSPNWLFLDNVLDIRLDNILASRSFIADFQNNWKSDKSKKLCLPEDWFTTKFDWIVPAYEFFPSFLSLNKLLPRSLFPLWASGWKESFVLMTSEELQQRHFDPLSFAPDFYLSAPAWKANGDLEEIPMENLCPDTVHSFEHFKDVYQYASHEYDAKLAVSSPFMCTPGCWLKYDTESRFPSALSTDHHSVDFSLLLHPIQTVPIDMNPLTPDVRLRATILNPALVVAIQGPAAWPDELACSPASSHPRPKDKSEALEWLAKAIEPSLKTHLINWQLRFEQGIVPTKDLPPWFMMFGLIYDAEEVTIVAHIPYMTDTSQYSFISCVVDTISLPLVDGSSKITDPWLLDRFRVGLALLSLQKHAFYMAGLWECVVWPNELVSWEEIVEREYLGPVLTPMERGYMVEPDPMAQLYREIHGSDETLLDHSGEVSDDEDEDEEKEDNDVKEGDGDGNGDEYGDEGYGDNENDTG